MIQLCRWNKGRIESIPQIACMSNEDDGLNHNRAIKKCKELRRNPKRLGFSHIVLNRVCE